MIHLSLPWPPSGLRPNRSRRQHWAVNSKLAADYKVDCLLALREQGVEPTDCQQVALTIRFHPPTRVRTDRDGSLSALKAGLDALSDVLGIDDDDFEPITLCRGEPVKGGRVDIVITEE